MLDDDKEFGYNLEFVGLDGIPLRADGHAINRGQRNGVTILGGESAIQRRFGTLTILHRKRNRIWVAIEPIKLLYLEAAMKGQVRGRASVLTLIMASSMAVPLMLAADTPQETAIKYILATVKAFRIVYSKAIEEQVRKAGVRPSEHWQEDNHAIMLNAQFVKAAGAEIKDFELGLIGLTPIYKSNLPKTQAEADALKKMMADPELKVLTFADGNQFKGLAADHAIVQACADCHNSHPQSPKKDFKQGDLMGAIVVRIKK